MKHFVLLTLLKNEALQHIMYDMKHQRWIALGILILLLTAGLALRLYRMDVESVDLEEYITLGYFDQPDLLSYLNYVHEKYKVSTPLSFFLQYVWLDWVGYSHWNARLLCVGFGVATLLLLYLFCFEFYGRDYLARRAGLFAVLLATLSPVFIFYSQEARQYPIYAFTALLAAYGLMRALRERRRRWWALNFLANTALIGAHPFGAFFLLAQGVILLFYCLRQWKLILCWGSAHFLMLLPFLYWMKDMPRSAETVLGLTKNMGFGETALLFFHDLFSDDLIHYAAQIGPVDRLWAWMPQDWYWPARNAHLYFDIPLIVFFVVASLWALWRLFRSEEEGPKATRRQDYLIVLLWMILPPLCLAIISWLKMPLNMTRYTMYATLGLYCIAGGFWAAIPWRSLRALLVACILVLYAYQNTFLLPGPVRTEWREIASYMQSNGFPEDPILFHGPLYLPIFLLNDPSLKNPNAPTMDRERSLCAMADFYFKECLDQRTNADRSGAAWVVLFEQQGLGTELESSMKALGIHIDGPVIFHGARRILLYRISKDKALIAPSPSHREMPILEGVSESLLANQGNPHWKQFLKAIYYDSDASGAPYIKLAASFSMRGDSLLSARCFDKAMRITPAWLAQLWDHEIRFLADWDAPKAQEQIEKELAQSPQTDPYTVTLYAEICLFNNQADKALEAIHKALMQSPENPVALFTLWRCQVYKEDHLAAKQALEALMRCNADLHACLAPVYEAQYPTLKPEALRKALEESRAAGMPLSIPLMQSLNAPH